MIAASLLRWAALGALTLYLPVAIGERTERSSSRALIIDSVVGRCDECGAPFDLGRIQFVSPQIGWAVGEHLPVEGNGSGVSTILHTIDGGRTWRRLLSVWQHGAEAGPAFWFLDARHGWASWVDESAVHHLSRTTDGGESWQKLPSPPGQASAALQFFDAENGISIDTRLNEKPLFGATVDAGKTWTTKQLPIRYVAQTWFLDRGVGWVVGKTDEGRLTVLKTVDGGVNWAASQVADVPYEFARACDWIDRTNGWLIAWLTDGGGSHLFRTTDGGTTWHRHEDESFQGKGKYLKAIRFLTKQTGYAFFDDTDTDSHYVLSTRNGGDTWERTPLKQGVSSCQAVGRDLWCGAGMELLKFSTSSSGASR